MVNTSEQEWRRVGSRLERDRRRLENMAGGSRQGNTGS
jgi:hypothetical protein